MARLIIMVDRQNKKTTRTSTDLPCVGWRGLKYLGLHIGWQSRINRAYDQFFDRRSQLPRPLLQRLLRSLNFLLTGKKNEDVPQWLSHVNLQDGNHNSVDVVRFWSFRVSENLPGLPEILKEKSNS